MHTDSKVRENFLERWGKSQGILKRWNAAGHHVIRTLCVWSISVIAVSIPVVIWCFRWLILLFSLLHRMFILHLQNVWRDVGKISWICEEDRTCCLIREIQNDCYEKNFRHTSIVIYWSEDKLALIHCITVVRYSTKSKLDFCRDRDICLMTDSVYVEMY